MERFNKYILDDDGNPVGTNDLMEWAQWFESSGESHKDGEEHPRFVARDTVGEADVSTVFLGLDHNFMGEGPPILWETMIFGGKHDEYQDRYSTREAALKGHAAAMKMVKEDADGD